MKNYIKSKIIQLTIWLLNKAYDEKNAKIFELIKSKYREIATDEFKINTKVVNVKKGKRRYELIFIESPAGTYRMNIGRRITEQPKVLKVA